MFLNIRIDLLTLKTYYGQFTLTTKKSLHIIFNVRFQLLPSVARSLLDRFGVKAISQTPNNHFLTQNKPKRPKFKFLPNLKNFREILPRTSAAGGVHPSRTPPVKAHAFWLPIFSTLRRTQR